MACSESEDHAILSMDVSEDTNSVHLDFDELPTEAQPPLRRSTRLAVKSSSINDWPLEKIL
ncbi:hypothetical protein ABG768_010650, partial [Culter alburnus]